MNNSFTSQLIYCYAKCMNNMSKTGCTSSKGNECPAPIRSQFLIGYLGTCARPVANQNVKFMCQLYLFPVFVLFLKGLIFFLFISADQSCDSEEHKPNHFPLQLVFSLQSEFGLRQSQECLYL